MGKLPNPLENSSGGQRNFNENDIKDDVSQKHSATPSHSQNHSKISKNHAAASALTLSRSIEIIKGKSLAHQALFLIILN